MYVPFETLIEQLGRSIQEAQGRLEQEAADAFFRNFDTIRPPAGELDQNETASEEWAVPRTCRVGLPDGGGSGLRAVDVPLAALVRHQAMGLDTVRVRLALKSQVYEGSDSLLVEPGAGEKGGEEELSGPLGEVEITFKSAPPAEGVARLDLNVQKIL